MVDTRYEIIISEQPPPGPPDYVLIDAWPSVEERRESHGRMPYKLLAIAALATLAIAATMLATLFIIPQQSMVKTTTATRILTKEVTSVITKTATRQTSLNASIAVLGSRIQIAGNIPDRQSTSIHVFIDDKEKGRGSVQQDGSFNFTILLVKLTAGVHEIKIKLDNNTVYIGRLTILKPTLTLASNEVKVNDNVTVFGFHFNLSQAISICMDRNKNNECDENDYHKYATADQNGFFQIELEIPAIPKDDYTILASDGLNIVSAPFSVVPHLRLNSTVVLTGKGLNITGYGFEANKPLNIQICNPVCTIKSSTTDGNGSFSLVLSYDELKPIGQYMIKVEEEDVEPVYYWVM